MPRIADPSNVDHQSRQARYRETLDARGEPEASTIDTAIAATFAAFTNAIGEGYGDARDKKIMETLILSAVDLLLEQGYSRKQVNRVFRRRMHPEARKGLKFISDASRIRQRLGRSP